MKTPRFIQRNINTKNWFWFGISLLYILATYRLFTHEMWRDEVQPWLISAYSQNLTEVFNQSKTEAHPFLWYLILFYISKFTLNPESIKILNLIIISLVWALILFKSPFNRYQKILILGGYYLFFEYFVITRSYGLAVLLFFAFAMVWSQKNTSVITIFLILSIMANTIAFGTIAATIWGFNAIFSLVKKRHAKFELCGGLLLLIGALIFAYYTLYCSRGEEPPLLVYNWDRFQQTVKILIESAYPLHPHFVSWLTNPKDWGNLPTFWAGKPVGASIKNWHIVFLLSLLIYVIKIFFKNRSQISNITFASTQKQINNFGPALGIATFFYFFGLHISQRHLGIFFLLILTGFWLVGAERKEKLNSPFLNAILVINFFAGTCTLFYLSKPFSNGKHVAHWISSNAAKSDIIVSSKESMSQPIMAYLEKPIYYLEFMELSTSIKAFKGHAQNLKNDQEYNLQLEKLLLTNNSTTGYLCVNNLDYEPEIKDYKFTKSKSFLGAECWDENFNVFQFKHFIK